MWWLTLIVAAVAFTFGMYVDWYIRLKRPFALHLMFPTGQVLAFGLPTVLWDYQSGGQPMVLQLMDDGKPPPAPPQPPAPPEPPAPPAPSTEPVPPS